MLKPTFIDWATDNKDTYQSNQFWFIFAENFGRWFVLILNIVPISMLVTLEGVKFFQAMYIQNDAMIYDIEKDLPTKA
jgi:hypothetical protein